MQICYIKYEEQKSDFARRYLVSKLNTIPNIRSKLIFLKCFTFICSLTITNTLHAKTRKVSVDDFERFIDSSGDVLLHWVQIAIKWASLLFCGLDVVKNIHKQDVNKIISIAFKYVVIFGLSKGLPILFDTIDKMTNVDFVFEDLE